MGRNNQRAQSFGRRAFLIGALQGVALGVLAARLAWLQMFEGGKYKTLADKNRINTKLIAPSRGEIMDRYGVPLAINSQNFRLLVVPEQIDDLSETLRIISTIIELKQWHIDEALKKSKKLASFIPIEVKDSLQWNEVSKLEVNTTDLPGVYIEEGELRSYPQADSMSHIVGFVGAVSKDDLTEAPVLKLPGFKIGKTGIEKSFDSLLMGKSGTSQMEVNVQGREVREIKRNNSSTGNSLTLSIDSVLQREVFSILSQQKSASAVLMDAHTGAIYALASFPSYDPNLFTGGISEEKWQEILNNPAFPLNNKALTGQYPPGSTFKMITALAALENKVATPKTTVHCSGTYEYGRDKFRCWKLSGHGYTNIISSLMMSCDTYFYKLSTEIGVDRIAEIAQKFGLGQTYNFDIREEKAGLVPTKEWKEKKLKRKWQAGETVISSIGQGYNLATPLQLAVMTARLVNGGKAVKPWLIGYQGDARVQQEIWPEIDVSQTNLSVVKKGMDYVVTHKKGTAHGSMIEEEGYSFGGKTGTAQVKKINRAERALGIMNDDLDWRFRHHALFVGYAPINNPRYVCSVVVEHGGGGSAVAAPIARDILLKVQKRDPAKKNIERPEV